MQALLLSIGILIVGFYGLIKGADIFVVAAGKIAQKFHIPMIVIGLTIVAMGTSAPEAAISITAAFNNASGITIGNIVGSNILNILLVLGVCSLIHHLKVSKSTYKIEIPFVVFITLALLVLGNRGDSINKSDAILLIILFIIFLVYLFFLSKQGDENSDEEIERLSDKDTFVRLLGGCILGLFFIVAGSYLTVDSAKYIATVFGVSERVIGLTVVAFGTSLPELITSATAVSKGKYDLAIGNIVGSNIFNILFVLGIAGLVSPSSIPYSVEFQTDTMIAVLSAVLLFVCCGKKRELNKTNGMMMLICYGVYFVFLLMK